MRMHVKLYAHHLPRIEGHGNIVVRIKNGRIEEARWDVVETPRFIEVMLKGKHYTSVASLAARICGICSISHCLASLRATENAFGVQVSGTAAKLRELAKHGETLQSHFLHLFFLAAPDFLGLPSAIPLADSRPEVLNLALRLKGLANRLCDAAAGRTTHPVSLQVGGVTATPDRRRLLALNDELSRSLGDIAAAVDLFKAFEIPTFERETEFVSLKGDKKYPFIGGSLLSSDGVMRPEHEYLEMTNEYVDANNTSKWTRLSRESYAVGPLARFNNNHELLHPDARQVAVDMGLQPVCHNPFMAHVARLVECVHCTHEAIRLIQVLTAQPLLDGMVDVSARTGEGVGAVEAPRGILFHSYKYDHEGRVLAANCVVPTTQNNGNIHRDLPNLIRTFIQRGNSADDAELERVCSMLVRSYDPCLSCAVH